MSLAVKRKNGLHWPYSPIQIILTFLVSLQIIGCCLMLKFLLADAPFSIPLLIVYLTLAAGTVVCWFIVEWIDPEVSHSPHFDIERQSTSTNNGKCYKHVLCGPMALRNERRKDHYCQECGKEIAGLDHHCFWLNTCIGLHNYLPFYLLLNFATLQHIVQTCVGVLSQFRLCGKVSSKLEWVVRLVVLLSSLISLMLTIGLIILLTFHTYLFCAAHITTFDYIAIKRERRLVKKLEIVSNQEKSISSRLKFASNQIVPSSAVVKTVEGELPQFHSEDTIHEESGLELNRVREHTHHSEIFPSPRIA